MKKRKIINITLRIFVILILVGGYFILNSKGVPNTVEKIYQDNFFLGSINECMHNNNKVYVSELNIYDAGSSIYDRRGNQIGSCNYAFGPVDDLCTEVEDCISVYTIENNIWGRPAVDKYGLNN